MPALVVLDDLHLLCPAPSQAPEAVLANIGSAALVAWLRDVMKEYHARPDGRPSLPGGPSVSLAQAILYKSVMVYTGKASCGFYGQYAAHCMDGSGPHHGSHIASHMAGMLLSACVVSPAIGCLRGIMAVSVIVSG